MAVAAFSTAVDGGPQLEARVDQKVRAFPGTVALYAKNLDTGEDFGLRSDTRVRTASTVKLPILVGVFAAVHQGKAAWQDLIEMRSEDKVGGSGVIRQLHDGAKLTLRDLVHMMIVVSDNTATNLVLDRVSADFVNAEMDKLGLKQTRVLRKVMGNRGAEGHSREGHLPEFAPFGLGVSTPREMALLMEKIEAGEVVDPQVSREILEILERQQLKEGIGRRRAGETASKSGALDALRSDVALVRSNGGRIAMAVTVDDMPRVDYSPDNIGNILIADVADIVIGGLSVPQAEITGQQAPEKIVNLAAEIDHVQGIEVAGDRLWLSWVHRKNRTGHLSLFDLRNGKLLRAVEVHQGDRYHPGGIAGDGKSIWVPVAEYRRDSSAVIQKRNRDTLELEAEFEVADHIGCVAVRGDTVLGGNWDSRSIYRWTKDGRQIDVRPNTASTSYQDMKLVGESLVASGLRSGEGAVDWLHPRELRLQRRLRAGKTSRGVVLTHEGMAISDGRIYFVPEDGPSRVFVYPLPW